MFNITVKITPILKLNVETKLTTVLVIQMPNRATAQSKPIFVPMPKNSISFTKV